MRKASAPIGVMDAGMGGYTVVKELQKILPQEEILYYGDGANQPYGNRSKEEILHLTRQCLRFLQGRGVKAVAVACNTISTLLEEYQEEFPFRIFSIVEAGSYDAVAMGLSEVGVLSTVFTAQSGCYERLIQKYAPETRVYAQGCPKLARIIEDGDFDCAAIDRELHETLGILAEEHPQLNALILGCTHFPMVRENIEKHYPQFTALINPAATQARLVKEYLAREHLLHPQGAGTLHICTTSDVEVYRDVAARNGLRVTDIELVGAPELLK